MTRDILHQILNLARWAPSGDNTQPWRFQIISDDHVAIHGFDTRDHVIYDFDGRPSQMAHGALLETLRIAASGHRLAVEWRLRPGGAENTPIYDVRLFDDPSLLVDPLLPFIEKRMVQRRPMRFVSLEPAQRDSLTLAAGPNYSVQFFERSLERFGVAKLLWQSAYIRLRCPEAFHVHREIIEWGARFSNDRLPEEAVGVDRLTAKLMRWVMQSWERVEFFNQYLMGTIAPRIQLDFLPALACSAHLLIRPCKAPAGLPDYVDAGRAMQRVWLTATALGLHLQPEMTPVIFRWYFQSGVDLSASPAINKRLEPLAVQFERLAGASSADPFAIFCRVGHSVAPKSRSLRRSLSDLLMQ